MSVPSSLVLNDALCRVPGGAEGVRPHLHALVGLGRGAGRAAEGHGQLAGQVLPGDGGTRAPALRLPGPSAA